MRMSKVCAILASVTLTMGMMAAFPSENSFTSAEINTIYDCFDTNYDGWTSYGETTVLEASDISYSGLRSMEVSGRTSPDDGAYSEKGFYLDGGINYNYSLYVYHNQNKTEKFNLSISYLCSDGITYNSEIIASETVKSGEWTEISTDFKAPEGISNISVKITTDSTANFCFDEFTVKYNEKYDINSVYAATADVGLKNIYANYFKVGSVLNSGTVKNSTITATVLKNFNSITFENELKPDATMDKSKSSGTNIAVSLSSAASLLDFCVKNNIGVRGHTLVWHSQTPEWAFKENFDANGAWVSTSTMDARMESYIKNMFAELKTQYPSLNLYAYDVANECISDDSNRTANYGGSRAPGYGNGNSPWVQIYGDNSFVEKAFTYARKYAPSECKLFYNDYNEYWDHKRDSIASMCESLYKKGLLDGIGMQSHIGSEMEGFTGITNYTTALKKFAAIGCEVQITELDISTENGTYTAEQQADKYEAIFKAAIDLNKSSSKGKVTALCIWGPNDSNTWIGTENSPLLFDTNNQPKAAYYAVASLIPESEWGDGDNPSTDIKPDDNGYYFHDEFEELDFDWTARGEVTLGLSGRAPYIGTNALIVSERTAVWNGASKSLSSTFKAGSNYSFSVDVQYLDGTNSTEKFYFTLEYTDTDGTVKYDNIDTKTAVKGQYVQLANTNYKIPDGASNIKLVVETADNTVNFYLDEAIGAIAGTVIAGPSETSFQLGDVNNDGKINIFDVNDVKNGFMYGFSDKSSELAADVDQSGAVNNEDIKLLKAYVLGDISQFPVAEKIINTAEMAALFSGIQTSASYKKEGENNPLFTQRFGADPGVMEYDGRIYVYTTNDLIKMFVAHS